MGRRAGGAVVAATTLALLVAACADDGSGVGSATSTTATDPATTTSTTGTTTTDVDEVSLHGIGVVTETFVDDSRPTPPTGDVAGLPQRTLETVISYPAIGDPADGPVPGAPPDVDGGPYPLVVFSHGLGGTPELSQDVIDRWVAAGFVVAAPRFPLTRPDAPAGPDAADVENQTGDVSFLVTTLTEASADPASPVAGLVDGERIGAAGHSNGAITTLGVTVNTCCLDERIDAAIEFAGTPSPFDGEYAWDRAPPLLAVHGTDDELLNYVESIQVFNHLPGPKGLLTIEGGDHTSWFRATTEGFDDVAAVTTDFLRAYLLDDGDALARLEVGATVGPTDLEFAAEVGSTVTIPSPTTEADRTATVEPSTGLTDGQRVTVTWTGYLAGGTVNVVQCAGGGVGGAGFCDLARGRVLLPNPTGDGSVELEIVVGAVGEGTCGPASTDCVVAVNDSGLSDDAATIRVPLELAG